MKTCTNNHVPQIKKTGSHEQGPCIIVSVSLCSWLCLPLWLCTSLCVTVPEYLHETCFSCVLRNLTNKAVFEFYFVLLESCLWVLNHTAEPDISMVLPSSAKDPVICMACFFLSLSWKNYTRKTGKIRN